jgi:hypothetical protein
MSLRVSPLFVAALLCLCAAPLSLACSTLAAGRLATADGSVFISQTTDGDGNDDARIVRVPAADWPPNSRRKIFPDYSVGFPRYVGTDRGAPLYVPPTTTPSIFPPSSLLPPRAVCWCSAFLLYFSYFPSGSDPLTNATGDIPQVPPHPSPPPTSTS